MQGAKIMGLKLDLRKFLLILVLGLSFSTVSYAQNDPRQIQSSPLCLKTIINNTTTGVVEPTTHRLVPKLGTTTINVNCQLSKQKQQLGTFFVTNAGHTANYQYRPDGSIILTLAGSITRPSSVTCSGCSGSVGIPISFTTTTGTVVNTTVNSIAQFSDCDNTGTCVCVPCPLQRTNLLNTNAINNNNVATTIITTNVTANNIAN